MRRVAEAVTVIILLSFSFPLSPAVSQPSTGNWVVAGTEVVENRSIALDGNLTIVGGGSLTLRNVTLTLNPQYNGSNGVSVEPDGSLFIYESNISSSTENRFSFVVSGSTFVMKNSEVHGVGWCSTPDCQLGIGDPTKMSGTALVIKTDRAVVEDSVFSGNAGGMILAGSYAYITGNNFVSNDVFPFGGMNTSYDTIANNTFKQDPCPVSTGLVWFVSVRNSTFSGNTLLENLALLAANVTRPTARVDGFLFNNAVGNIFLENNVTALIPIFLIHTQNSLIIENKLSFGESGILLPGGAVNSRVIGNDILPFFTAKNMPRDGINLNFAHNSVVANNSLSGFMERGIYFDHTSNSSILNNNLTLSREGRLGAIILVGSKNNTIAGNMLSDHKYGIILASSSESNLVTQNDVRTDHSVAIIGSSSNTFYENNLYDFEPPNGGPYDDGTNAWYYGKTGNYWSHYTGQDENGNGVGDSQYNRAVVLPNGTEPFSQPNATHIEPSPVPQKPPITLPVECGLLSDFSVAGNTIKNQVMKIDSGCFVGDSLTIVNSTVLLGEKGQVNLGGKVTILNSTLINKGYGFIPWAGLNSYTGHNYLIVKDSKLEGAILYDVSTGNIMIEDSEIVDPIGDWAVAVAEASSVVIVNNRFSGELGGINNYWPGPQGLFLIEGNQIYAPLEFGMMVSAGPDRNLTVLDNVVVGGKMGTGMMIGGENVTVRGNTVYNFRLGVELWGWGPGGGTYDNNITNTLYPIRMAGDQYLYHNNFVNYTYSPSFENYFGDLSLILNEYPRGTMGNMGLVLYEGNYWSGNDEQDTNLDGIGDVPYGQDRFPITQPSGWLTKFYLSVSTNLPSIPFQVNGTNSATNSAGNAVLRLGYVAHYQISFPQLMTLSNGDVLTFERWGDGFANPTRIMPLNANSSTQVVYALTPSQTTTTATSTTSSTSTSSSATWPTSTTTTTSPAITSTSTSSSATTSGGLAEYLPYAAATVVLVVIIVALAFVLKKRG